MRWREIEIMPYGWHRLYTEAGRAQLSGNSVIWLLFGWIRVKTKRPAMLVADSGRRMNPTF